MHEWGDEWFETYGNQLYNAIDEIEKYLHKHHIGVCGKEKYGCYVDEYLRFWNGGLYEILFGYSARIGTCHNYKFKIKENDKYKKSKEWFNKKISRNIVNFVDKIHDFIYSKIDYAIPNIPKDTPFDEYSKYYDKRIWKGLIYYNEKIGLTECIHKIQAYHYNKIFQIVCKKYPDIIDELILDTAGCKMIKPCKWGSIDGETIHKKYWKPLEEIKETYEE